jgi:thymidylate synthase (FAD)
MELVHRPTVELVAATKIRWEAIRRMLESRGFEWSHTDIDDHAAAAATLEGVNYVEGSDGALLAEMAGRGCYNSYDGDLGAGMGRKTNRKYIEHIIEVMHGSVLEHAWFTFAIWGNSRGFTHELVRHRVGTAFSQSSTRFRDEGKFGRFVVPPLFRDDPASLAKLQHHADKTQDTYLWLVDRAEQLLEDTPGMTKLSRRKTGRGAARSVLSIGTESSITVSMNIRQLRNFFDQRATPWAELEIREIAMDVYDLIVAEEPVCFFDYKVLDLPDGTRALETEYRKV